MFIALVTDFDAGRDRDAQGGVAAWATKQVLFQLGRVEGARDESRRAVTMTRNECGRALLSRRGEIPDTLKRC
jgi:predicted RNA polymerase sigma factor